MKKDYKNPPFLVTLMNRKYKLSFSCFSKEEVNDLTRRIPKGLLTVRVTENKNSYVTPNKIH